MMKVHHINGGYLQKRPGPRVLCHGLLLENEEGLTLVDTGIGLQDVRDPVGRVGAEAMEAAGFEFSEAETMVRQMERRGFDPARVKNILLTHADPDHAGGLADFPDATVHVSVEEKRALDAGVARYRQVQFAHGVRWQLHGPSRERWFGLEARRVFGAEGSPVMLVPLFGHTLGQCGVAIAVAPGQWVLHVGDAYYLRGELDVDPHPVTALAVARAEDDAARRRSLAVLRGLAREHAAEIAMCGYHDPAEWPGSGE